jgi:hypothetical protein
MWARQSFGQYVFSDIQKSNQFLWMNLLLTTEEYEVVPKIDKFQPRSFNMGLSLKALKPLKGLGIYILAKIQDLSMRLWNLGFETKLIPMRMFIIREGIDWENFRFR